MSVCAVVGCFNSKRKKNKSFFRVPAIIINQGSETHKLSESRHEKWLSRIRRTDLMKSSTTLKHLRICSDHFVSGSPTRLYDHENPDWLPSLRLSDNKSNNDKKVVRSYQRYLRYKTRQKKLEDAKNNLIEVVNVKLICNSAPNATRRECANVINENTETVGAKHINDSTGELSHVCEDRGSAIENVLLVSLLNKDDVEVSCLAFNFMCSNLITTVLFLCGM